MPKVSCLSWLTVIWWFHELWIAAVPALLCIVILASRYNSLSHFRTLAASRELMRLKHHLLASNRNFFPYLRSGCVEEGALDSRFTVPFFFFLMWLISVTLRNTFRKQYYIESSYFMLIQYTEAIIKPSHVFTIPFFLSIPISISVQASWIFLLHLFVTSLWCLLFSSAYSLNIRRTPSTKYCHVASFSLELPKKEKKKTSFACGYPFFRLHRHSHFVTCTTLLYAPFFWTLSQNTDFSAVMSTCLLRYLLFVIAWVFCSTISICVWIAVLTHAWRTSKGSVVSG